MKNKGLSGVVICFMLFSGITLSFGASSSDSLIMSHLANVYDYGSLHNVSIETDKAALYFSNAKIGKLKIVKQLPLFDGEKTVWILDKEKMLRRPFITTDVDTGRSEGLFDLKDMLANALLDTAITKENGGDTSYYRISIADFKRPWFLLSFFAPTPVLKVTAVLHVQVKTLQIREIEVKVFYTKEMLDSAKYERYFIKLGNYRKVKGVWIPQHYFAAMSGIKEELNSEAKRKILATDLDNPTYTKYVIEKFQSDIARVMDPNKKIEAGNKIKHFIFGFRTLRYNIVSEIAKGNDGFSSHVTKINENYNADSTVFKF